ncbi:MAG: metalloregulator ArsR/SmtB family transcription factor [Candidatus Nanopelagicales bacterium]
MKSPTGAPARVARALLDGGPATATALAQRLGLSPTAVRRHLDALEADGLVEAGERPPFGPIPMRGRGRPAKVYSLTPAGRDAFDQAYDDLAVSALRFLADGAAAATGTADPAEDPVMAFARQRAADLERRYAHRLAGTDDPEERARLLADALTEDGYAASTVGMDGAAGTQLCQHHCPVAHVAEEFPQLCEAETEAFSRLLGTHALRLATLAHGDGVCTTHVPAPSSRRSTA